MKIHLVTHTHWDREWYRTYEEFRIFLVDLMDKLLDHLDECDDYKYFLLDGQTVLLEDYLEIHPYQSSRLRNYIQSGRIIIGPMYTQPDEYIPSAESLVRNFLIGSLICEEYGRKMKIGYFPDSFGQASQIPQILNGFCIDRAVFWRGLCDEDTKHTEFYWESSDGSKVLVVWMPFSYGNAYLLPVEKSKAINLTRIGIKVLGKMATTNNILFMRGWDHSGFSPEANKIIDTINKELIQENHQIVHSNLENLFDDIQKEKPDLKTLVGEFRKPKTMRIHPGIDSTRMNLKQLNRKCQNLLEKFIEPICSMNWVFGRSYPQDLINHAWKNILQSQAHDSICGCCTDQASRRVQNRFLDALEIEEALLRNATAEYAKLNSTLTQDGIPLMVINTLPYEREDIVKAEVVIPFNEFVLKDHLGNEVPYQVISQEKVQLGIDPSVEAMRVAAEEVKRDLLEEVGRRPDDPAIYYSNENYVPLAPRAKGIEGQRINFQFPMSDVLPCGNQVFFMQEGKVKNRAKRAIIVEKNSLENDFIRVEFHINGTFNIIDKINNITYKNQHLFQDGGDAGDTYNYSPPESDKLITSENTKARIAILDKGPLIGRFRIALDMEIPDGLSDDGKARSQNNKQLYIESEITLGCYSKTVSIHTKVHNSADDHRLQVLFPCGFKSDFSFAEEQFGIIKRLNKRKEEKYWKKEKWTECPLALYPQQTFMDVNDGNKGLAILNRNITEYEVLGDNEAVIAVVLFRSIGAMGRPDLVIRPGRASGLEVQTPDALLHGELEFDYAILPHQGAAGVVAFHACRFNAPMIAVQTNQHTGVVNSVDSCLEINPSCLIFSCLKKAERENALILRIYNSSNEKVEKGKIRLGKKFSNLEIVNLNEQPVKDKQLEFIDGFWYLPVLKSNQILSLKITAVKKISTGIDLDGISQD